MPNFHGTCFSADSFLLTWEGYVVEQVIRTAGARCEFYYYRTHQGAEIDLMLLCPTGKK